MREANKFKFAIDRGGTFTDVYARCPSGKVRVMKLLSVDPNNYPDAPREGIRRILEQETGLSFPPDEAIDGKYIEWIRMGTTVATNALLERKGEKMALLITKGFKDLLYIGNQARPKIFDLAVETPEVLYSSVLEVECRVVPARTDDLLFTEPQTHREASGVEVFQGHFSGLESWSEVTGITGETLLVAKRLDEEKLKEELVTLKNSGINSIAVALMHSYTYFEDELLVGKIAEEVGFGHVSLSHRVMPMLRIVPRGFTACADAYLTPHIKNYLKGFSAGFKDHLKGINVLFMQSDGGLTPMESFNGSRAILSGPAGGVVGYAKTSFQKETDLPVIGFDMGGTSTDVSRFSGRYEHVFETTTAGITIQAPQLDVNTVAAGGGSMLFYRSGLYVTGPESAGAHPGPACYRKGGPLTVTDANLVLHRILPNYFPRIFGPGEDQPLDKSASTKLFEKMLEEINAVQDEAGLKKLTVEEVAMGFIRVANEAMCRPIRALTQAKGYDTSRHALACFGGAGAQHACAIARALGMKEVLIHKYAGILSAYGMALADVVHEAQEPCAKKYTEGSFEYLDERIAYLEETCRVELLRQGFSPEQISVESFLHMRYDGTDCALMCSPSERSSSSPQRGDFMKTFIERYRSEFGFTLRNRDVLVDDVRVRGVGKAVSDFEEPIEAAVGPARIDNEDMVYFEGGYQKTNIYLMEDLKFGHVICGPAIIMDQLSTILIEPDCRAEISQYGNIKIFIGAGKESAVGPELDPIQLSIFSHRFMSIAEQMGRILQRTAISTNIKERLDFSCALFGPDGGLVSNAPHIPVHLGAMQETVQFQMKNLAGEIFEGDVILSNHPCAGGSHLPDLTVITPVFLRGEARPVFFVASRGHHADIGGSTPGSMPPHSKSLAEEGATFRSFKIVDRGVFQEEALVEALMAPGKIPGCSGTRNLSDNLSDLKAQIAANQKGISLVQELITQYGLDVVQAYMGHIQSNAESAVRAMLREIGQRAKDLTGLSRIAAEDYMDDGSKIQLEINIDTDKGCALVDFTGTGPEVWGNCNAPRAITLSALIYCLRCLVGHDVPLNQGCLAPVKVIIPKGSILDPSDTAAVVGGNVQTSQRIVDVVLKAFEACAASQGCMNNITFGENTWGYYETVAGGAGAGPTWEGRSGVHTHMTNTRITDPEVVERRYPVILRGFHLREGSGGRGKHRGGDGVVRELLFRRNITLSIITERRVFSPYGLIGGEDGLKGNNLLLRRDGRIIYLGSKTAVNVLPGDVFRLETPGGGGFGRVEDKKSVQDSKKSEAFPERGSYFEYVRAQESV